MSLASFYQFLLRRDILGISHSLSTFNIRVDKEDANYVEI